jgi:hypothetical protein
VGWLTVSAYIQGPNDIQDYAVTWTLDAGDTITASTWASDITGITVGTNSFNNTPGVSPANPLGLPETFVRLSNPAAGFEYNVTNHITTAHGKQKDHTIQIFSQGGIE